MTTTLQYYTTDHLGSRKSIFAENGTVIKNIDYNIWGESTDEDASFTGKELDSTGLYYFNARYYDPLTCKFVTEDPAKQGDGWYNYCNNNPLNFIDKDGREPSKRGSTNQVAIDIAAMKKIDRELYWEGVKSRAKIVLSTALGFVPVVGDVQGMQQAITGQDSITGETLSPAARVLAAAAIIPGVSEVGGLFKAAREIRTLDSLLSLRIEGIPGHSPLGMLHDKIPGSGTHGSDVINPIIESGGLDISKINPNDPIRFIYNDGPNGLTIMCDAGQHRLVAELRTKGPGLTIRDIDTRFYVFIKEDTSTMAELGMSYFSYVDEAVANQVPTIGDHLNWLMNRGLLK